MSEEDGNSLIEFISEFSGDDHLKVEENLGSGFVRLRTGEAERRQAKHDIRHVEDIVIEMLRNARDAGASRIFLATAREGDMRSLTFIDNGSGIPEGMKDLIFEPRVTSKLESMVMDRWGVHGRGMALYSIKQNTRIARVVNSGENLGSALYVDVDTTILPEKRDQSTYPVLVKDEEGQTSIARGPHNIIRTLLEFALERRDIDVYLGSPTEVAGTLFRLGSRELSQSDLLFNDDIEALPLYLRPAACADALQLANVCESLGLLISERSAHRIIANDINPLRPAISKLIPQTLKKNDDEVDIYKDRRGLKLSSEDIEAFSRTMEQAFEDIAERYYLSLSDVPKISVSKDCIRVRFDIEKDI